MRPFSLSCELFAEQFARYYSDLVFAGRQEGVILKPWNSSYVPGAKSFWMKLKRVYIKGLGDTADFAVIGACLSKQTSFKFTANQQRLGGIIGSFIIACLENKQELRKVNICLRKNS
jgi:DNA ligase-4